MATKKPATLEEKLARLDRKKEALQIQKQIKDLRDKAKKLK